MIKSYKGKGLFIFVIVAAIFIISFVLFIIYGSKRSMEGMSIILNHETKSEDIYGENVNKDGYLDGLDVIYYINLDRSVDRRNHMERIFENSVFDDIKVVRFPAYDGKNEDMKKYFTIENIGSIDNTKITNIEYACTMSHLYAIKQFSESSHDIALICEDDITLEYKKYWKKTIKEIINEMPSDWEIIQVAINPIDYGIFEKLEKNGYVLNINSINNPAYTAFSTTAYIINKNSAKKLIKHTYKNNVFNLNNFHLHGADNLLYDILKTYICIPYFTYTTNTSTIHQDHLIQHVNGKNMVTSFLKKLE